LADSLTVYDLDGTILISPFKGVYLKKFFWKANPNINKKDIKFIITARTSSWRILTWITCWLIGLHIKQIIFNPINNWDIDYISKWKCQYLIDHKFNTYIDNDPIMLNEIRLHGFQGVLKSV